MKKDSAALNKISTEIANAAQPTHGYFIMTALATILACYGLLANSTAVIIGAMLVAMLLYPITGLSFGLVTATPKLLRKAALAEFLGAILVFSIGLFVGFLHHNLPITQEMLNRTDPTLLDLVIAVAGGAASSYATGNARLNSALAGVAIATALVPPLANAGMLVSHGEYQLMFGSLTLYVGNYAAVLLSAMVIFWLMGHRPHNAEDGDKRLAFIIRAAQLLLFLVLLSHLTVRFVDQIEAKAREIEAKQILQTELANIHGARLVELRIAPSAAPSAIVATVRTPKTITPALVKKLEQKLPAEVKGDLRLRVRSVPVTIANSDGYLFTEDDLENAESGAEQ